MYAVIIEEVESKNPPCGLAYLFVLRLSYFLGRNIPPFLLMAYCLLVRSSALSLLFVGPRNARL